MNLEKNQMVTSPLPSRLTKGNFRNFRLHCLTATTVVQSETRSWKTDLNFPTI